MLMLKEGELRKGRGAQSQIHNPFENAVYEWRADFLNHCDSEEESPVSSRTKFIDVHPKSIFSKNSSPDVPFNWSINPYQGCEHGCVYCYARNSHEYWGYNAGLDFERVILIKQKVRELVHKKLSSKTWKPALVVLSGNTDCYQPIERKKQLTRQVLQTFLDHRHPIGVITKNAMIQRDVDVLKELAARNLLRVTISITTLNESLRRKLEPRTASVKQRLKTVELLSKAGIPVRVNAAPIIPALNSSEVFDLVKASADAGAQNVEYILVRLNGRIAQVFEEWIHRAYPERAEKVLNLIKQTRQGKLNDSRWGARMKGDGAIAQQIADSFKLAKTKYLTETVTPALDFSQFGKRKDKGQQLGLF